MRVNEKYRDLIIVLQYRCNDGTVLMSDEKDMNRADDGSTPIINLFSSVQVNYNGADKIKEGGTHIESIAHQAMTQNAMPQFLLSLVSKSTKLSSSSVGEEEEIKEKGAAMISNKSIIASGG